MFVLACLFLCFSSAFHASEPASVPITIKFTSDYDKTSTIHNVDWSATLIKMCSNLGTKKPLHIANVQKNTFDYLYQALQPLTVTNFFNKLGHLVEKKPDTYELLVTANYLDINKNSIHTLADQYVKELPTKHPTLTPLLLRELATIIDEGWLPQESTFPLAIQLLEKLLAHNAQKTHHKEKNLGTTEPYTPLYSDSTSKQENVYLFNHKDDDLMLKQIQKKKPFTEKMNLMSVDFTKKNTDPITHLIGNVLQGSRIAISTDGIDCLLVETDTTNKWTAVTASLYNLNSPATEEAIKPVLSKKLHDLYRSNDATPVFNTTTKTFHVISQEDSKLFFHTIDHHNTKNNSTCFMQYVPKGLPKELGLNWSCVDGNIVGISRWGCTEAILCIKNNVYLCHLNDTNTGTWTYKDHEDKKQIAPFNTVHFGEKTKSVYAIQQSYVPNFVPLIAAVQPCCQNRNAVHFNPNTLAWSYVRKNNNIQIACTLRPFSAKLIAAMTILNKKISDGNSDNILNDVYHLCKHYVYRKESVATPHFIMQEDSISPEIKAIYKRASNGTNKTIRKDDDSESSSLV